MKVLSLIEPWAILIKDKKKFIETRSWKTEYRGELYIHASITKVSKDTLSNKELMDVVGNSPLNFGYIVCKCKLVDCIYMTKEYVEEMKKNNYQEYVCGEYEEGRYAWVLKDIEVLDKPIKARGQLNIWNYYSEDEVMDLMNNIEYGWIDRNNNKYGDIDNTFSDNYILQTPNEVIKNKIGICWDQAELERYYFKSNDWNIKTYFIVHYDGYRCPSHTFLTFKKDNKYYWFEHSWEIFRGIHEYDSLKELLIDVRKKFIDCELSGEYEFNNLVVSEYKKPRSHISAQEFYKHCECGNHIDFEKL